MSADAPSGAERRTSPRVPLATGIVIDSGMGATAGGWIVDIAFGGVRVRTRSAYDVGQEVRVFVPSPEGEEVSGPARVLRVHDDGQVALRFDDWEAGQARRLRSIVHAA